MAPKRMKKSGGKRKTSKVSLTKLSNKRLNKLAKQGKLKKKLPKSRLLRLIKDRTDIEPEEPTTVREKIPLDNDDFEFYGTGKDFSFLTDLPDGEEEDEKKTRKRKKEEEDADIEASYEKMPRKNKMLNDKDVKPLLPIKSKKGIIPQEVQVEKAEEEEEKDVDGEKTKPEPEPLPALSTAQLLLQRQQKLEETKQKIGVLATGIIENPEEGMSKLKELRSFLDVDDPDIFITARKLAAVSLLEVFKDIIPEYHIRVYTDQEKQQSMKKETKVMRAFEESLLKHYRHYLEFLEAAVKGKPAKTSSKKKKKRMNGTHLPLEATTVLRELGLRCLGELLVAHPNFNYRNNIISVLVQYMNSKSAKISDMVCNYMKRVFKEDRSGDVSLQIVRLISKMTKNLKYDLQPKVLNTFLSLKIKEVEREDAESIKKKKEMKKLSKREKKRNKQMSSLKKELEDAAALDNKQRKLRTNTQIIESVFLTYFRILKTAQDSVLLSAVLEGLAKFAHVISVDFLDDLFLVLHQLVESTELTYRESLHCVQTVFTLLSGQGTVLNIDPLRFYSHLYKNLFHLHSGVSSTDVPIALECLNLMINRRKRQVSHQRLLAFMKRMATLCLCLPTEGAVGCLGAVRSFIHVDPKSDILFDTEYQGSGIFMPELDEPEHCNAHNTALYELTALRQHYHPAVKKYASHVLNGAPSHGNGCLPVDLARRTPVELYKDFDTNFQEFKPPIPNKPASGKRKKVHRDSFIQRDFQSWIESVVGKPEEWAKADQGSGT